MYVFLLLMALAGANAFLPAISFAQTAASSIPADQPVRSNRPEFADCA